MKTSRYISILLLISLHCACSSAKNEEEVIPKAPLFCGAAVQVDLAGPVMKAVGTRFDQLECAARLNFRDHYFPIAELGLGESDREGQKNNNTFHTRAPYVRIGIDYNVNKKHNGNRTFVGLRYAFSRFSYDFKDPDFDDPVWQTSDVGLTLSKQKARMQWIEACLGFETKLWSFIRMGWTMRFKIPTHKVFPIYGDPYYTPGFGKNGGTTWGGTCNLIFDVGRTSKKQNKKHNTINEE